MIEIGIVTIGSRISKKDVHKSDVRLIGVVVHRVLFLIIKHKVNRCRIFAFFLVEHGTKGTIYANIWPKMTNNAYFGPNLAVFWPKILIYMGGSKSFDTHITETDLGILFALFFWSDWGPNGPKMPIFGKREKFWYPLNRKTI